MKNYEKYKTIEEADKAWYEFCYKHDGHCELCPVNIKHGNEFEPCSIAWLYLEAEGLPQKESKETIVWHD